MEPEEPFFRCEAPKMSEAQIQAERRAELRRRDRLGWEDRARSPNAKPKLVALLQKELARRASAIAAPTPSPWK